MSARVLARLLAAYLAVVLAACVIVYREARLVPPERPVTIVSRWQDGALIDRRVVTDESPREEGTVAERVTGEAALFPLPSALAVGLVSGRDGVSATLDGTTAYVTVDDLLAARAYDHGATFLDPTLGVGVHPAVVLHLVAERLGIPPGEVTRRASLRRVRFERQGPPNAPPVKADTVTPEVVQDAAHDAARYLARHVDEAGRFRYLVDATTDRTLPGYNWPRHAGATYFLAQAARYFDDPGVRFAMLRAASRLRDDTMVDCGKARCIADDREATAGASALALIAFTEIVDSGADGTYLVAVRELAAFLRAQQRPDGEFMHVYRRDLRAPVDVQYMYTTGEAALALGRAHRVTGDPADLAAASAALAHLARGWSFFGSRYFFAEEHWTCQAVAELWDRAPDREALTLCLRWNAYQNRLQQDDGDGPFDADGAFGFGPFVRPRVTPASSRGEGAAAALAVLERSGTAVELDGQAPRLELQLRRALAFVLRHRFAPGPRHLLRNPDAMAGAIPATGADLDVRIDYPQHAGSMMLRWLELRGHR